MPPIPTTSTVTPLRVSDNGRHFLDKQEKPFFWLGDTLWHLFRSFTVDEVRAILENRKARGFSVVLVMLIGYEQEPQPNVNGALPWVDGDPSRLNEKYLEHVDRAMQVACDLDFVQVLGVYHKWQDRFHDPARAKDMARAVAQRYRDVPQLIWSMYPEARLSYRPIVRSIAEGLAEGDGGAHWVTDHPDPNPQSSSFLHDEPWLPFNMLQACTQIELVHPMTQADYGFTPVKPVVMAEGGYEGVEFGRHITPLDVRRQAYWSYLAGGHHVYGHNENWTAPANWREWIEADGARQLGVYRRSITSLPDWWDIIPNQSIFTEGVGSGLGLNAAAHSTAADWALIYLSGQHTASIRMSLIKTSEKIAATWIDPRTGDRARVGVYAYDDAPEFTTPQGWEDALVLLEAE